MMGARFASVLLVVLSLAVCNGLAPQAILPPNGIQVTGSTGTTGAAWALAGSGVISTTRP